MKLLTDAEVAAIKTKPAGKGSHVRTFLLNLKIGENLLIERKDWTWKRVTPSTLCRRLEKKFTRKFNCDRALDGSGWIVKREK